MNCESWRNHQKIHLKRFTYANPSRCCTYTVKPPLKEILLDTKLNRTSRHPGYGCDICHTPIIGIRYSCSECRAESYDICSNCIGGPINHVHPKEKFLVIGVQGESKQNQTGIQQQDKEEEGPCVIA
jgi:hypothetical protein